MHALTLAFKHFPFHVHVCSIKRFAEMHEQKEVVCIPNRMSEVERFVQHSTIAAVVLLCFYDSGASGVSHGLQYQIRTRTLRVFPASPPPTALSLHHCVQ